MYKFLKYRALFQIQDIVTLYPDGTMNSFSCSQVISAKYDVISKLYHFTFENRRNTSINNNNLENSMDVFMSKVGELVYPVTIITDENGYVSKIKDFINYKARYEVAIKSILNDYNNSVYLANYVNMSLNTISEESLFTSKLQRNIFIKHILLSDNILDYVLYNSKEEQCHMQKNTVESNNRISLYHTNSNSINGKSTIERDEYGVIEKCRIIIQSSNEDIDHYVREIKINVVSESKKIDKKSWLTF